MVAQLPPVSGERQLRPRSQVPPGPSSIYVSGAYCYSSCEVLRVALTPATNTKVFIQNVLLAFDKAGQLIVYNAGTQSIAIYPPNGAKPSRVIDGVADAS